MTVLNKRARLFSVLSVTKLSVTEVQIALSFGRRDTHSEAAICHVLVKEYGLCVRVTFVATGPQSRVLCALSGYVSWQQYENSECRVRMRSWRFYTAGCTKPHVFMQSVRYFCPILTKIWDYSRKVFKKVFHNQILLKSAQWEGF